MNSITSPSTSSSLFTVVNPVTAGAAPPAGPVGGTLGINGSGFGASQNGVVSLNGVTANVSYTCPQNYYGICWTDTQIQVSANTKDFLWSGLTMKATNWRGISHDFPGTTSGFLCTPDCVAEREGFEPPVRFPVLQFSRLAPSTTRPPLRN